MRSSANSALIDFPKSLLVIIEVGFPGPCLRTVSFNQIGYVVFTKIRANKLQAST